MKIFTIAAALAAVITAASPAQATEYVVDGSFAALTNGLGQLGYNTDAPTWTTTGYNFVVNSADVGSVGQYGLTQWWDANNGGSSGWNGLAPNGTDNYAALDGDFSTAALEQTITGLTVGQTYHLSFVYAFAQQEGFDGDTLQGLIVSLGDTTVLSTLQNPIAEHGFSGWQTFDGTVTATGTTEVLSFLAQSTPAVPPFSLITDVSLIGSVPEASTWGMMIVGLGALGALVRRRNRSIATA